MTARLLIGFTVCWALCLIGCAGSGGSPPVTGPTSNATFQVTWPARSRSPLSALASALSVQVVLKSASATGQDVTVNVDRDTTQVNGYVGTYTVQTPVLAQGKTLTATFYAGAAESGATVGAATAVLSINGTALSLTNLQLVGTITAVAVNSATMLTTDSPLQLTFSATDKNGNPVAVSAGSAIWTLTSGSSISLTKDGISTALAAGTSNVSANVDGLSGTGTVMVSRQSTGAGLASSAWPKFHHDALDTGLGAAGGAAGVLQWKFATGNYVRSSAAVAVDGTIYVGSDDESIYAINPNGTKKWSYQTLAIVYSSPAVASDGTIYVGCDNDVLYALNSDGTLKWKYTTGDVVRSSPSIGTDGTVYVGSNDHNVYAINSDGTLKWKYFTGGVVQSSPALALDGSIYVGSADGNLYALTPSGTLKWKYATGGGISSSPAVAADGSIYVGSADQNLYALTSAGSLKWKYATGASIQSSPAVGSDGTVYLGGNDYYFYAFTAAGTVKWTYQTGSFFYSSPAIGSDGSIYIGNGDGYLYAFDPTGAVKWKYLTGDHILPSPAIGADGTLYFGSYDQSLYAIR